jgi:uncharacterized delta-60 repeat protein
MKSKLLITVALIISSITAFAQAGTLDLSFNNADIGFDSATGANGSVRTASIQSDGKIFITGDFTSYNGTPINGIARLNANGILDTSFNPGAGVNNPVYNSIIQSDGKIIIVGDFTSYDGTQVNRVARINANGTIDTTFNAGAGANESIFTSSIQSDGKILIGGNFTSINGISANRIARLNTNGSIDTSFDSSVGANKSVRCISISSNGYISIGGDFTNYNGRSHNFIARLNEKGQFYGGGNREGTNGPVNSIYTQSDGKIIICGNFSGVYNSTGILKPTANIVRLDGSFNPVGYLENTVDILTSIFTIQSDGKIVIGGSIKNNSINNPATEKRISRINADGTMDVSFDPGTGNNYANFSPSSNSKLGLIIQNDGKVIIFGDFTSYNGNRVNRIARLYINGSLDGTFNPKTGVNGTVRTTSIQSDGKIIIGGDFTAVNGTPINRIARLNTNGTLDTTFNPGIGANRSVFTSILQSDGKIIIGGDFTSYNGTSLRIARLNQNGTLDTTFNLANTGYGSIRTSSLQSDGKIVIGGGFSFLFPNTPFVAVSNIARLNSNGTIDTSFNLDLNGYSGIVNCFSIQSDGKIIIGGNHTSINGGDKYWITRRNSDGTFDNSFATSRDWSDGKGTFSSVTSTFINSDGKIYIGKIIIVPFTTSTMYRLERLNANGSTDDSFAILQTNGPINTISTQSDGKIIIGGGFSKIPGVIGSFSNPDIQIPNILRLNINGTLDNTFKLYSGNGADGPFRTISIQSDGKIIAGGDFTAYGSKERNNIIRINGSSTSAPTGNTNQTLCSIATITNLTATGFAIKWYPTATGGTALVNTTTLVNGTTYYASQTVNGIESTSRLAVTVSVTNTAAPTGSTMQTFCSSATIADLTATGTSVKWYSTSTGGTTLAGSIAIVNGTTYYASQTLNSCESTNRLAVTANITNTAAPTGNAMQTLAFESTVSNISVTGTAIKWYSSASGGTALTNSTVLVNGGVYYASQTVNSCESSSRLMVTVTVSPLTLVHDNFTIQIKSETCAGKNNGEIIINAKQSYNYTATINNTSYPFTNNSLNLKDLPAGMYTVCIGITGKSFQQCYTLTIGKGGTLTGKVTSVSKNSVNVEITEGTAPFEVILNGSTKFNSNQSSFSIDVSQGDLIIVKSSVACEGIYSKTISELPPSKLIAYPNPTKGMFEISVPSNLSEAYVEIFSINSNLIFKGTYPVVNQKIQLNLENLNKGVYVVKTYLDSPASLIIIKE